MPLHMEDVCWRRVLDGELDAAVAARARALGWTPPPTDDELDHMARTLDAENEALLQDLDAEPEPFPLLPDEDQEI